jgi:hypothetical protein
MKEIMTLDKGWILKKIESTDVLDIGINSRWLADIWRRCREPGFRSCADGPDMFRRS